MGDTFRARRGEEATATEALTLAFQGWQQRAEAAEKERDALRARVAELEADRCPKCHTGPMQKVPDSEATYCLACLNEIAASAEADGLEEWRAVAEEYKSQLAAARARVSELEAESEDSSCKIVDLYRERDEESAKLAVIRAKPLYARLCTCGDFEYQHEGGGPCGVCCQSSRGGDGCEMFEFCGQYEKLTDIQKMSL